MTRLTFDISMSPDGFVAGPNPTVEQPLGEGGSRLHEWAFAALSWRERHGRPGGEANADSDVVEESTANTGAVLMGRQMFGGGEGPWGDPPWEGWQKYLEAGLLDEFQIHVAPVLLGDGVRLFGRLDPEQVGLECTRVIESPAVTHLSYRIVK